jgi:hypothetical protein
MKYLLESRFTIGQEKIDTLTPDTRCTNGLLHTHRHLKQPHPGFLIHVR